MFIKCLMSEKHEFDIIEKYNDVDCTQDFQICNWVENISL